MIGQKNAWRQLMGNGAIIILWLIQLEKQYFQDNVRIKNPENGDIRTDIIFLANNVEGNDWHTWCKKIKN